MRNFLEKELDNLRGKNQNKNTSKITRTWPNIFRVVQRNEARKLEDIPRHELDAVLCRFFAKIINKDGHEYKSESLAVMQCWLDRHLKNCGRNYSILRDREFANSRQ